MRWIDLIKRSWINIKLKKKRNLRIIISITIGVFSVFMMLTLTMNIKERINFLASDYDKYREIVIQAPLTAKNSSDFKEETDSITGSYSNAVKELDIDSTNELLNSYKNNLEDGYKLYNMNWNLGYIDNFIVRTNTMAVSKNRLKTIKNEKGALVSRSFLNNIITAENYSKGRPMKE
ncbi:hypothetical protein, partial [Clostridium polynesiense]|uniref:hypothetical protein n=1 Tax=Clostridium polynesiense TaxID=1325933 RepID=UPI0011C8B963